MPRTKTAKKELRKNARRRKRNTVKRNDFKKVLKTSTDLKKIYQAIDKAAKAGIIKNNKASRLKSRLAKRKIK